MLLTDLQTRVGLIAERPIPDQAILVAATEVVSDIERRDGRLVVWSEEVVPKDGSGSYTLTTARHSSVTDVYYEAESGVSLRLLEFPPSTAISKNGSGLKYYYFTAEDTLKLPGDLAIGQLRVVFRRYKTPLELTTDVAHTALFLGTLAWFGKNVWLDQRADSWEKSYEAAIRDELSLALSRTSKLGNLGERN